LDELPLTCKFAAAVPLSPTVKAKAAVALPWRMVWGVISEMVGGVFTVLQSGKRSTSFTVAKPLGSVTVRMMR
jgi:hypothetical protein